MPIEKPNQINNYPSGNSSGHFKSNLVSSMATINLKSKENSFPFAMDSDTKSYQAIPSASNDLKPDLLTEPLTSDVGRLNCGNVLIPSVSDPMKSSPSIDYLSVSPSYGPCSLSFDNQSFDETTPDEFAPINFLKGITNINYDFTFSDNSAENSISEDVGDQRQQIDELTNQLKSSDSISSFNLDEFDPLRNTEIATSSSSSLQQTQSSQSKPTNINLNEPKPTTLIESEDSPNQVHLPSPLKPTATDYKGFSNSNIPTISCNMGDFSSLNHTEVNDKKS